MRKAHVVVDRNERASTMMGVAATAKAAGGEHDPDPSLIDENASLVEEPFVVTGGFDEAFLALPPPSSPRRRARHQKYFCVAKPGSDELLPHYLTVVNTALAPEKIAKGNNNVMRARLSDAKFFYEKKTARPQKLEDRVEKLGGIVFHNRLGTVREKIAPRGLSAHRGAGERETKRACAARRISANSISCRSWSASSPSCRGDMGRSYALHAGEPPEVANAVRDHYRPAPKADRRR